MHGLGKAVTLLDYPDRNAHAGQQAPTAALYGPLTGPCPSLANNAVQAHSSLGRQGLSAFL